ncbi:MAG: hypothetical protein NTV63_04915 [Candidatus Woesearchaeota archaeon]|nr:hypothetical protein [Candidatus Woesearchaeota archaeon]
MIGKWIKKMLGIDELENKVSIMISGKADLEAKVIDAESKKALVKSVVERSVAQAELGSEANDFLASMNITITENSKEAALSALKAADVVERYDFKRFSPSLERGYDSPIITMAELQAHPAEYMHKLDKGFLNFPLGLNFSGINKVLNDAVGNSWINQQNGAFNFHLNNLLDPKEKDVEAHKKMIEAHKIMVEATTLTHINKTWYTYTGISFEPLDFLSNYNEIVRFISELPEISEDGKKKAISGLEFVRFSYLTALETVGKARIKDLSTLLDYTGNEKPNEATGEIETLNPNESLKRKIKMSLLSEIKGTTYDDVDRLLPIKSRERFVRLASEITAKILASDEEKKGLTSGINKPLSEYSVGEALVLSAYFARNVITKYKKLEDTIKDIFSGKKSEEVTGKCTDYTALALHYLREYLIPMQPEKFANWKFGVEEDNISDYRHSYIQAVHINMDLSTDIYFLDPTQLANRGISELKTKDAVIAGLDTKNLPILIQRDAEDLLYSANEKMGEKECAHPAISEPLQAAHILASGLIKGESRRKA